MQRKSFGHMQCPVARSLEHVGDWWNILILREAFYGTRRFDDFQTRLGITPSTLTRRLDDLVEGGMFERHLYSDKPPRHEYALTARGEDFRPVLLALYAWGNRNFAPEGRSVQLVDAKTGEHVEPIVVDAKRKRPLERGQVLAIPGPAANATLRKRLAEGRTL